MDLSEANIKAAKPGDRLKDKVVRGLELRATAKAKSFLLYYRAPNGQQRRPKIGEWGQLTLTQARAAAREMLTEVAKGNDPSAERAEARAEPDMTDLWVEYWKHHGSHKKTGESDQRRWRLHIEPRLGRHKLSEISFTMVAELHAAVSTTSPIEANRVMAQLSKMFSFAHRPLEWMDRNPTKGVKRNKEVKRERYMEGEEAARISELLHSNAQANPASVAFLYLLILTGARCGEIANAKWSQIEGTKLVLSEHKTDRTGEKRIIHLPQAAMDVIERLPRTEGTITGILSPKKFWERIRVEAGCPDLRMHDLRHSFASAAIAAGLTLAQIGELLGHKSTQTTKRYAHLMDEVASAAVTATADIIAARMKKAPAVAGA
jgi:integrase